MKYLILILALILVSSCKESTSKKVSKTDSKSVENVSKQKQALALMTNQCYICHNPSTSEQNRIAPPMIAVKKHYLNDGTTEAEFVQSILNWVNKPEIENTKMPGAVKRFGIMPYQQYKEDDIKQIASYMFNYDIEQPEWFDEHYKNEKGEHRINANNNVANANTLEKSVEEIGLNYALTTKQVLGQNLMGAIQKSGTLAALEFCNIKAYPLTDSMAVVHNVKIKRVSDKPRNLKNAANKKELGYIASFKDEVAKGIDIKPKTEKNEAGEIEFYYPILTNSMCLQCHGTTNEVKPETLTAIKNLYPADKALGYGTNEVRGIWSIRFEE